MAAVANNPEFAKKAGVPKSVGEDFVQADKRMKLKGGQQSRPDLQKTNVSKTNHGKSELFNKGGEIMKKKPMMPMRGKMAADNQPMPNVRASMPQPGTPAMMRKGGMTKMKEGGKADMAQDKAMVKKALRMHDAQEHKGGKGTDLSKLKKGGMPKMAGGGLASGHKSADGIASKGKTKGTMIKMSKGGKYC